MTFEQDYSILIEYAQKIVWEKRLQSDPSDLVNDAFVAHAESGNSYRISEIKKIIAGCGFKEQNHQMAIVRSETWKPAVRVVSSYCKACKDEKPLSGFYLQDNNTVLVPFGLCKDCYIKKQLECYYANKQKWLDASKRYKENNKEKIKLKKQEYHLTNKPPKIVKVKPIKFKLIKLQRRKTLLRIIKPPKPIPLTVEEKRLKQNERMRNRRSCGKQVKYKPKPLTNTEKAFNFDLARNIINNMRNPFK